MLEPRVSGPRSLVTPAMTDVIKPPITVTVIIETPTGSFTVSKVQQFRHGGNQRGRTPTQSLSDVWKAALADVNPYIRRHDTVVG